MKQVFNAHELCEQDGPLGPYIESYDTEMRGEGYARHTRELQTRLVADFGCWLAKRGIRAQDITAELFRPYLRARARRRRPTRNDLSALQRLLELLRRQGVVAAAALPVATPAQRLQSEFGLYLRQERALASTTQAAYTAFVNEFLTERFGTRPVDLSRLCAADVTRFVRRRAGTIQSKRVQLMTTALRSFLRFARYRGDIDNDLAACIPAVANWKQSTLPRALPPEQVEQVLNSVNRKTAMGRRDYTILLILARLGLRAGEIRALTLEDLDWKEGLITVRGKAGRFSQLPLPKDVGAAIADYLRHGRPAANSRCVFLRAKAPAGGFQGQSGVGSMVRHALERAGIDSPRKGAHQFRHALACQMLKQGASLSEIGELLRHRSPQTTAIYAKVDLDSLASLLAGRGSMIRWRKKVEEYVELRRSLGFKLLDAKNGLIQFASFLEQGRATHITIALAMKWAQQNKNARPAEWAKRLSFVRGFARHWSAHDSRTEVPSPALLPYRPGRARPYLYSSEEIRKLLQAARRLPSAHGLRGSTYYSLLGLLAVAGLRVSEARNLQTEDVDLKNGVLTIRRAKFGKCRLVPIHPSTRKVLSEYASRRDRFLGQRPASFFVSGRGTKLDGAEIRRTFYSLSRQIGLRGPTDSHGPRLHDFRHRFAVETLVQWYRSGQDVERRLPALSTYLGHVHVTDTYWYLSASPELMGLAVKRFEDYWEKQS